MICCAIHRAAGFSVTLKFRTFHRECAASRPRELKNIKHYGFSGRTAVAFCLSRSIGRDPTLVRSDPVTQTKSAATRRYATISADCTRLTSAAFMSAHAFASEPFRSMPREASSITVALKPALRASSAVHATQKSVARPAT